LLNIITKTIGWRKYKSFYGANKNNNRPRPKKVRMICRYTNHCSGKNCQVIKGKCKTKESFWYNRVIF